MAISIFAFHPSGVNIAETLAAAEAAAQIAAAAGGANTPEAKSALSRLFNFTQNLSLPPNSGIDIFSGKWPDNWVYGECLSSLWQTYVSTFFNVFVLIFSSRITCHSSLDAVGSRGRRPQHRRLGGPSEPNLHFHLHW